MTTPTIGVLALQGDVREHARALVQSGAVAVAVRRPEELDQVDALVIPGGESTTMWKLAVAFEMFDPIQQRVKAGMPTYGSCAGMIMLADRIEGGIEGQQTLGGLDMVVRRNAFGRRGRLLRVRSGPPGDSGLPGDLHPGALGRVRRKRCRSAGPRRG